MKLDANGLPIIGEPENDEGVGDEGVGDEADGWKNHGDLFSNPDRHQGWVKTRAFEDATEEELVTALKGNAWSFFNWVKLMRHYKENEKWQGVEIACLAARYIHPADEELKLIWLDAFCRNRETDMTEQELWEEANRFNQAVVDAVMAPKAKLEYDIQFCIFYLLETEIWNLKGMDQGVIDVQ